MLVKNLFADRPDEELLTVYAVSGEASAQHTAVLNREHTLSLYQEGTLLHRFICSPSCLGELCAGWLLTEGYGEQAVEISRDGHTATVQGCCAAAFVPKKLPQAKHASPEQMLALFQAASEKYDRSHGIHECIIKADGWTVMQTDIGRHNAIDKAVGAAVLAGYALQGATVFTSGRINVQTVQKAARCGISCLMSKAVITAEALRLARELGMQVLFSVKESSYQTI